MHSDSRRRGQQSHNFRQLETGELLSVNFTAQSLRSVDFILRPTSCLIDLFLSKPSLTSFGLDTLYFCVYSVYSSVNSVFILVLFMCVCVPHRTGSPAGAAVLTVLYLFEVLSLRKSGNHSLVNLTCFKSQLTRTRAKIAAVMHHQPFELSSVNELI